MITKYFISGLETKTDKETIEVLSNILIKNEDVLPAYTSSVIEAEINLATGIDLNSISIAIPHTNNAELINNTAVAIGILKKPVSFGSMIVVSETTPVSIVFLLAVKGINEQLAVIARLMKALQNEEWVDDFCKASSENDMRLIFDRIDIDGENK